MQKEIKILPLKKLTLVAAGILLSGCQSMGDHFNCMAEVDRTVPAQTQQRYIRTDTKCSSSGGGIATPTTTRGDQYIVNTSGETKCTSTPIYETIVLNQAARDSTYQQCRGRVNSQRNAMQQHQSSTNNYPNWTGDTSKGWKDDGGFKPNANWSVENLCSVAKGSSSQKVDAQKELIRRNEKCN